MSSRKASRPPTSIDGRLAGRDLDTDAIAAAFWAGTPLVVYADRPVAGKTALMGQVAATLREAGAVVATVGLRAMSTSKDVLAAVAAGVLAGSAAGDALAAARRGRRLSPAQGRHLLDLRRLWGSAVVDSLLASGTPLGTPVGTPVGMPVRPVEAAVDVLERTAAGRGARAFLVVDDAHELAKTETPLGDGTALAWELRNALQDRRDVAFALVGRAPVVAAVETEAYAFYRHASAYELGDVEAGEWARWGEARGVDASATQRLLDRADSDPTTVSVALTMLAARAPVTAGDVDLCLEVLARAATGAFHARVDRVRARKHAFETLLRVVESGTPYAGYYGRSNVVRRSLAWLQDEGILWRRSGGDWHVSDPLFADYLRASTAR